MCLKGHYQQSEREEIFVNHRYLIWIYYLGYIKNIYNPTTKRQPIFKNLRLE